MIGPAASLLRRRRPPTPLVPFGPAYDFGADGVVHVRSGPLAGVELKTAAEVTRSTADFALHRDNDDHPVAHCHYDRDSTTGIETLYSIVVRPDQRRRGLAALLVRLSLRCLFAIGRRHSLRLRQLMVTPADERSDRDPGLHWGAQTEPSLRNIGIGIIAVELGLAPVPATANLLSRESVKSIQFLPADENTPPGILVRLNRLPGTMLATFIDPATQRPVSDPAAYRRLFSPAALFADACAGRALLGNVDYLLPPGNITRLAARIADNQKQLTRFSDTLRRSRMK